MECHLKYPWNVKMWLYTGQLGIQLGVQEKIYITNVQLEVSLQCKFYFVVKMTRVHEGSSEEIAKWKEKAQISALGDLTRRAEEINPAIQIMKTCTHAQ